MGEENESAAAANVYALEEKLAKASMTRTERRDPYKTYNKKTIEEFSKESGIDWATVMADMKVTGEENVIVGMPDFFKEVSNLLNNTSLDEWKQYLKFHVVNDMAPYLSSNFDQARFDFYGKVVRGQQAQKPRWKRVYYVVNGSIGELLGQMYVDKHFKPEAKERMTKLVSNLQETYHDRIMRLDWMSDATKQKAIAKLNTFVKRSAILTSGETIQN